jgi:hypothetical protein
MLRLTDEFVSELWIPFSILVETRVLLNHAVGLFWETGLGRKLPCHWIQLSSNGLDSFWAIFAFAPNIRQPNAIRQLNDKLLTENGFSSSPNLSPSRRLRFQKERLHIGAFVSFEF